MHERDHETIRDYYSRVLKTKSDLASGACCSSEGLPVLAQSAMAELGPEITRSFYGCGSPIPEALAGRTVLDLGCGSGRDVFICSKLVGESGRVIGLDMTEAQLEIARRNQAPQAQRFGFKSSNVDFRHGLIEDLAGADIADESVDVVISNCVINLSPDKNRVFAEIMRVLKPGGELYFSDVFADRRLPAALREDPVLLGECLAGALYEEDFRRLILRHGVPDARVVSRSRISLENPELESKLRGANFFSLTIRAFKLSSLEDRCEDFGQVAWYKGTIEGSPLSFRLDDHHELITGKPMLVCGNTAAMLGETRYAPHFRIEGDRSTHYGLFPCDPAPAAGEDNSSGGCC